MANKYCNLTGTNKIKDEYTLINDGFELVENDIDSNVSTLEAHEVTLTEHTETLATHTAEIDALAEGSPAGVYANLTALTAAFPDGDSRVYVTTNNGNWNYWNGSAWVAGGLYQSPLTDSPANTIKGNNTGATAPVKDLTVTEAKTLLDIDDLESQLNAVPISDTSYGLIEAFENAETAVMQNLLLHGLTVTNLITNGNFADGTSGWTGVYSTLSIVSGNLRGTSTGTNTGPYLSNTKINASANDKIYIRLKVRVNNDKSDSMSLYITESYNGSFIRNRVNVQIVNNPIQDQWYDINNIYTLSSNNDFNEMLFSIRAYYPDLSTSNGKTHEIKGGTDGVLLINLTDTFGAGLEPDLATCQSKFPYYFDGTKSVDKGEVSVIGKNLFDGIWEGGYFSTVNGTNLPNSAYIKTKNYIMITPSTQYAISHEGVGLAPGLDRQYVFYDDNKAFISPVIGTFGQFTTPTNARYVKVSTNASISLQYTMQIEKGATITTYAPYNPTRARYPKLQSVPAIQDTFNVLSGLSTQNVQVDTDISGADYDVLVTTFTNVDYVYTTPIQNAKAGIPGTIEGYTRYYNSSGVELIERQSPVDNVSEIGTYSWGSDKRLYIVIAKGTYANIEEARIGLGTTTAMYQLATPILTYYPPKSIPLEINSSIIHQSIMSDIAFYATEITISDSDYPIETLQEVILVNTDDGTETPIDIATCTVASGGLTFTSTALTDGDLVWFRYEHTLSSATPTTEYTYTTSLAGGLTTIQNDVKTTNDYLQKQIDELRAIIASMAV